jgi:isoquinoline 1-oxidoreductase beta subunit
MLVNRSCLSGDRALDPANGGTLSRRSFLQASVATGGGLLLSLSLPGGMASARAASTSGFAPDAFIRIDPTGRVTIVVNYVEMGQGTYTSIPMLIAEELEVDIRSVHVEHAPPDDKLYMNPVFGFQATGGSTAMRAAWEPMRRAGATARTMLIAAAAERWNVGPATCRAANGEVIHAASRRRMRYGALTAAAAALPIPTDVALKRPEQFKLIGTPAKRLDAHAKVDGTAVYGIDVKLAGMKIATFASAPVFGGRVRTVDDTDAKSVPGVRQVVRLDDAVAVVADHMWAAKKGLATLRIEWDDGPNAQLSTADIVRDLEVAAQQPGATAQAVGDFGQAISTAATTLDATYELPFLAHATMEPMNCTVDCRPDGCEVWVGTQVLARAQAAAAQVAGLPLDRVQVHNHLLGGGFGRRLEVDGIVRAVQIARQVRGPVKVIWTREEDIQHDMYRPYFYDRVRAGLDAQGRPVAWSHRITGSSIMARWIPPAFQKGLDPDTTDGAVDLPYAFPNVHIDYVRREPPGIPTAFWRSVGPSHNVFVVESFIDELAAAARKDPVEFRRSLLDASPRAQAVLALAAEQAGWARPLAQGVGRGVSLQFAFGSYLAQVAEVELFKDGEVRVRRVVCAVDCGIVVNPDTVRAQIEGGIIFGIAAALYSEITLKNGRVEQSNFHDYRVVRANEAPLVEIHLVKSGEAPGGIGEPGTSCVAPALTNAIFALTGKRIRKLPVARQAALA